MMKVGMVPDGAKHAKTKGPQQKRDNRSISYLLDVAKQMITNAIVDGRVNIIEFVAPRKALLQTVQFT